MVFETHLAQSVVAGLFKARLIAATKICRSIETPPSPLLFDRIDLAGDLKVEPVSEPHDVRLADGSVVTVDGTRLKLTQDLDVRFVWVAKEAGVTTGVNAFPPQTASMSLSMRLEVKKGNASLCVEFDSMTLPPGLTPEQAEEATKIGTSIEKTCTPIPFGELLSELSNAVSPTGPPLFDSAEVLNAGLAWLSDPARLSIRIETDAIDADAAGRWQAFHHGQDSPPLDASLSWMITLDSRLFSRMLDRSVSTLDAESNDLELSSPQSKWHASKDVIALVGITPKKLASSCPTLVSSVDGTSVDACPGVFGSVDIDFTATVRLAFDVPVNDALRVYSSVGIDASGWDKFKCGVNLAATFAGPLFGAMNVFGLAAAGIAAFIIVSMAGAPSPALGIGKNCTTEGNVDVCDLNWPAQGGFGTLRLTSAHGLPQGLALSGEAIVAEPPGPGVLSGSATQFTWHPVNCQPIPDQDQVRAEAAVTITGAQVCDAVIVDDPDSAYHAAIGAGKSDVRLFCTRPPSNLPPYPCRILVATTRGLFFTIVEQPPAQFSMSAILQEQQVMCSELMSELEADQKITWAKWPMGPVDPDPDEIIPAGIGLVTLTVTFGGSARGRAAHLQLDDTILATNTPGPLGFTALSAAVAPGSLRGQFSVVLAREGDQAPLGRSGIAAELELWRHAGRLGVSGKIVDFSGPGADGFWMATTHGVVKVGYPRRVPLREIDIPMRGVRQVLPTEYGVLCAGDHGLVIVDAESGEWRGVVDGVPARFLARRGDVFYVGRPEAVEAFHLRVATDVRAGGSRVAAEWIGKAATAHARSGKRAGGFLVLERDDAFDIIELRDDGGMVSAGSVDVPGLTGVHPAAGSDMRDAVVATAARRSLLVRFDVLRSGRARRPELHELPGTPWFVDTARSNRWLVRRSPGEPAVDVFELASRIDFVRREARVRARPA